MKNLFNTIVVAIVCIVIAGGALGRAFHGVIDPRVGSFRTSGISPDTWVEDGAQIRLGGLMSGVNVLELAFTPWRPPAVGPAQLQFFLCEKSLGSVVIEDNAKFAFRLDGSCEPQVFTITSSNPFVGSETDSRRLAVQLEQIAVSSKLGIPLVASRAILVVGVALWLLAMVWQLALGPLLAGGLVCVLGVLLARANLSDATNIVFLYSSLVLIGLGMAMARRHPSSAAGRLDEPRAAWLIIALCAFVLVLVAASLRFYGLEFGLPGRFHPDETPKFNAIEKMFKFADWNPRYFLHPSLLLYLSMMVERVLEVLGLGWDFNSLTRLSGRTVSALAGSFSVALVFFIGSRLYSRFVGLFAALLLAGFPLHVTSSRYMKEDALMLFFLLFTVYLVIVAVQTRSPWRLILAGVTAGLCFGTKYTGLLSAVVIASAPVLVARHQLFDKRWIVPTGLALLLVPVFFVIATPYSILDFDHFLRGVSSERKHMLRGHTVAIDAWSQLWMYHVRRSLWPGMTPLPFLGAFIGLGLLVWRRRREDLWLIALCLLFFLPAEWVKAKPAPQPERYMIPCLPFLALMTAELIRVLANTRLRVPVLVVGVLVLLNPFWESTRLASELTFDTREKLGVWMAGNLPADSKVLVDWIPYAPLPPGDFRITLEMFQPGRLIPDLRGIIDGKLQTDYDYLALSGLVYNRYFNQPFSDGVKRQVVRDAYRYLPVVREEVPSYKTYGFHNPAVTLFSLRPSDRRSFVPAPEGQAQANSTNPWPKPAPLESWLWKSLGGLGDWYM